MDELSHPTALRIVLAGPEGAGKSTFIAVLARELAAGRIPGATSLGHSPADIVDDAVARLELGYPVRLRGTVELRLALTIPPAGDAPAAVRAPADPVHDASGARIATRVSIVELAPGTPDDAPAADGWLALLPPAVSSNPAAAPDWQRTPAAPIALVLSQADQLGADMNALDRLAAAWPEWVARAAAHPAGHARFALSGFGRASATDPARPDPGARPFGLVEPIAWLVRTIHDARWRDIERGRELDASAPNTADAARQFARTFNASPHRGAAASARLPQPARTAVGAMAVALVALAVSIASALRAFDVWPGADPAREPIPAQSARGPDADRVRALVDRGLALEAREPTTVDDCDEIVFGLAFVAEQAALDPSSTELASAQRRARDRIALLRRARERLERLRSAEGARDWPELVAVIDALWVQGSTGAAHEKLLELRRDHWRAWSERTRGGSREHREIGRILEAFVERCRGLEHATTLLKAELGEARRFIQNRAYWERLFDGGAIEGVVVELVEVHRDGATMHETDGAAQLAVRVGGRMLTDHKDFEPREPDAEGWYRYELGFVGALAFDVPRDGAELAIVERNLFTPNHAATTWVSSPADLLAPLGSGGKRLELDVDGHKHVRVTLRFDNASRYVLDPLDGAR